MAPREPNDARESHLRASASPSCVDMWIQSAKLGEGVNEGTVVQTGTFGYLLWWRVKVHAARPERANQEYDQRATHTSPIDHYGTGLVQPAR